MGNPTFSLGEQHYGPDHVFPTAGFIAAMAAVVSKRRGGPNMKWVPECRDFVFEVTGWNPASGTDRPDEYDWSALGAVTMAEEMLQYD